MAERRWDMLRPVALIALICLPIPLILVFAGTPSDDPASGLPDEPESEAVPDAAQAWVEHPAVLGGPSPGAGPVEVDLGALEPDSSEQLATGAPQTHLQGQFVQHGPRDFEQRTAPPEPPEESTPEEKEDPHDH